MASVMAIESEAIGHYVEELDVSVDLNNGDDMLCCGWKH
jgi:hypothetical protein